MDLLLLVIWHFGSGAAEPAPVRAIIDSAPFIPLPLLEPNHPRNAQRDKNKQADLLAETKTTVWQELESKSVIE